MIKIESVIQDSMVYPENSILLLHCLETESSFNVFWILM